MRRVLAPLVAAAITSPALRDGRRRAASWRRRLNGTEPMLHFFYEPGDPYSHLAAQYLDRLAARYAVRIVPHLVPPPDDAAAPERARLEQWGVRDAQLLAPAHGLAFPEAAVPRDAAARAALAAALAPHLEETDFGAQAVAAGQAFWAGDALPPGSADAALAEGASLRAELGHYLGATFYFDSEWFWGIDRLHHLQRRLAQAGLDRAPGAPPPAPCLEVGLGEVPAGLTPRTLHFFLSFRSPYTYIAAARARRLAEHYGAEFRLRPVLPMVMRGLPVPGPKRLYIVRDTKREAERLGLPFGRIADPVGPGVERGLAVLHRATRDGKGPAFAESFLAGAFAEGIDAATDAGLFRLAERVGIGAAEVRAALADESWRAEAEANRAEMFAMGLWGVPSFRVDDEPGVWGQDRLWVMEQALRRGGAASA